MKHPYFTNADAIKAAETIAAAVIKKALTASCSEDMEALRRELQIDRAILKDSRIVRNDNYPNSPSVTVGRGYDLAVVGYIALKEEARKYAKRHELTSLRRLPLDWLEEEYTQKALRRRVIIRATGRGIEYREEATNALREISRAIRRAIEAERAPRDTSKYLYLDKPLPDGENAYERLPLYADLGGYACTLNGYTEYTASEAAADYIREKVEALHLTARQAEIMRYRLKGYGAAAIGSALHISEGNVYNHIKAIRTKAAAIGLTAEAAAEAVTRAEAEAAAEAEKPLTDTELKHIAEALRASAIAEANAAEANPNPVRRTDRAAAERAEAAAEIAAAPSECITYTDRAAAEKYNRTEAAVEATASPLKLRKVNGVYVTA